LTVLSIFLASSLNFLSNNLKNTTKFGTVREKSSVKICNKLILAHGYHWVTKHYFGF